MPEFMDVCEMAARRGGQVLLDWQGRFSSRVKGPKDVVTEADLASQEAIRELVLGRYPDHDFLGEEDTSPWHGAASRTASSAMTASPRRVPLQYRWVVDPLDGTANYARNLPTFAVSVALELQGEVIAGAVYDPSHDECYTCGAGLGAWLNGNRIHTSRCDRLSEAMVAASFAPDVARDAREVTQFIDMLQTCHTLRRLGSAALNLCYVAAGRMDGYWSSSCKIWDVAAGILLVREAGGVVTSVEGNRFDPRTPTFAAAANPVLHRELVQVLSA